MSTAFRAAWIFSVSQPPIRHGYVVIDRERIVEIGSAAPHGAKVVDLGDVAILPRPVNAHTHLEFSDLTQPLGVRGQSFADWISEVLALRASRSAPKAETILRGIGELQESLAAGVGEIATLPIAPSDYGAKAPPGVAFAELLSTDLQRGLGRLAEIVSLAESWPMQSPLRFGLSPHAPYTMHWQLLRRAIELATQHDWPVAMHLGESLDEMELLRSHSGKLHQLLIDRGVWNPAGLPRGIRLTDYLEVLAKAPRALAIHGNFFSEDEYEVLARHRERLSLVICPRTCDYFLPTLPPIGELIAKRVHVAIGTDSRATNPDLSIWNEAKFLFERQGELRAEEILRLVTLAGAEALGLSDRCGQIAKGVPISALSRANISPSAITTEAVLSEILEGNLEAIAY